MLAATSIGLAAVVQTAFLVALVATDAYDVARTGEAARLVGTYVTIAALFGLVEIVVGARPRAATAATVALYILFVSLNFARFQTTGTFDYGFAHENVRELLTPLGRRLVTAQVRPIEIVVFFLLPIACGVVVLVRSRGFSAPWWSRRARTIAGIASVAVLLGFPAMRWSTHEALTAFVSSAYRFHAEGLRDETIAGSVRFPFVHEFVPSKRAGAMSRPEERRPHVIVLFLESWSGIYTGRTSRSGRAYTPVYDARRRDGLTFDHFYAASIQSSRGRFATMCSLVPLTRGKEFEVLADASLSCLPRVLSAAGYRTFIHSASDEPDFERSREFFEHIGFEDIRFADPARRGSDPRVWGAGVEDATYYRELFTALDEKVAETPGEPLFAVAINASNHYPFNTNPAHVPDAEGATKYARNYVASLRTADAWLATFFEELDRRPAFADAIVVLVGDHSFPADEHGIHFNGLGAHEESFRTAFALRWRGHVPPTVVSTRAASQLDLAPTITDLLQIGHTSQFEGRSLVADDDVGAPALMVQPYDGVRLAAVQYPFKLEVHEAAQQEHLYDLSEDPDEDHDLLGSASATRIPSATTHALRAGIEQIRQSQAVLRGKRVWPTSATDDGRAER